MALRGLQRLDHVGFTVPDLDEAEAFLVDVLGCERLYEAGPASSSGQWMREHLNVHPEAVIRRWRFYRCPGNVFLETFEYESPDQALRQPRNSDIGGHHLAFYVEDIDEAVSHLREMGVEVFAGPSESAGPAAGQRWVYFLAPWGMQFELVSYPRGKAYEQSRPGS